ncbi:MAG: hypothetical protein LBQ54_13250 [Planctomycetaceae bacterium]|jgi:hypothetical protein|nr:hypothetical protein [Planctomycetaceae bacterium]
MFPIDSGTLPELPAPFWFVEFFKVLGFCLHILAMNLWFAGLPMAIIAFLLSTSNSRRFAVRMFSQLPVIMALGINFGIVPLLFIQVAYYKPFYTSTIFMAWHWFLVIPLLAVAYYGLYLCAYSLKPGGKSGYLLPFGLISMFCLLAIAYIQVNAMSLMGRPDIWNVLWNKNSIGAATLGTGINSSDPTLWLRYGSMFGLALVTSAVWMIFDANWLIRKTNDENQKKLDNSYRLWTKRFASFFAILGGLVLVFSFCQYLQILKTLPMTQDWLPSTPGQVFSLGTLILPLLTAVLILFSGKSCQSALLLFLIQFIGIAFFAIFRQFVQNLEVSQVMQIAQHPVKVQWDTLIPFLVIFVIGVLIIVWMLRQLATAPPVEEK